MGKCSPAADYFTSGCLRRMKDAAFARCDADHMDAAVAKPFELGRSHHSNVERNGEPQKSLSNSGAPKGRRILVAPNDQKIEIAVRTRRLARPGAKQNDPAGGERGNQPLDDLRQDAFLVHDGRHQRLSADYPPTR